jgi:glycosyltransferase involved in cell wall biosynthesis
VKPSSFKPAIVIAAYNRAGSLQRLMHSLERAHYPDDGVKIIISVDGGGNPDVAAKARSLSINQTQPEVIEHPRNLGLRDHILFCGSLAEKYGSVIVLEDDLVVDPWFYQFACASLEYYDSTPEIAGIALYSQRYNDHAELPFEPFGNGHTTFFMQVGCSWGQIWSAKQWQGFKSWYDNADDSTVKACHGLPDNVKRWSESSWKKYFNAYIVDSGKFIVYPYDSYTTNCSDSPGVHIKEVNNVFQVALKSPHRAPDSFNFAPYKDKEVAYDAYMEPCGSFIYHALKLAASEVEIDLHGHKPWTMLLEKQYALTLRVLDEPEVAIYPVSFRPIEMNFVYPVMMEDTVAIRLYKMRPDIEPKQVSPSDYFNLTRYYSDFDSRNMKYARGYFREFWRNLKKFYF